MSAAALGLGACAKDDATAGATTGPEAGSAERTDGAAGEGGAAGEKDAGATLDASDAARGVVDGPGEAGAECGFNRDCNAALRCECTESAGCACKPGVRGTGQTGITPCIDGNACASSLCIEGPPDGGNFCSDECDSSADCTGALPLCSDIAFVGRVCIRQPPK